MNKRMPFFSHNLNRILASERDDLDVEVDLVGLCQQVAAVFGEKASVARALLANVKGTMKLGTIGVHLLQILKHDSAVRDFVTTGHLAKLLSRLDVFRKTADYRIIGMWNPIFDEQSQLERAEYFRRGVSLEMDGDLLDSAEAQSLMKREAEILENFR